MNHNMNNIARRIPTSNALGILNWKEEGSASDISERRSYDSCDEGTKLFSIFFKIGLHFYDV